MPKPLNGVLAVFVVVFLWVAIPQPAVSWAQQPSASAEETESADLRAIRGLMVEGRYSDAEAQASRLLLAETEKSDPDSARLATLLDLSVESRVSAGEFSDPDVLAMAERAVRIRERVLSDNHVGLAHSLSLLARVFFFRGEDQRSRELMQRTNAIIEGALGPDDPALALGLVFPGEASLAIGDSATALAELQRALAINERALGPEAYRVAATLDRIGRVHKATGDYVEAKAAFERALAIVEKIWGAENPYYVVPALNNVAGVLVQIGDFDTARDVVLRAVALWEQLTPPLPLYTQLALMETMRLEGLLLSGTETGGEAAVELAARSLAIAETLYGEDHPASADGFRRLADALLATGARSEAIRLYERSLVIFDSQVVRSNLALALIQRGDLAEARAHLEQALRIVEAVMGRDHPSSLFIQADLGVVLYAMGDRAGSLRASLAATESFCDELRRLSGGLPERQALGFFSNEEPFSCAPPNPFLRVGCPLVSVRCAPNTAST